MHFGDITGGNHLGPSAGRVSSPVLGLCAVVYYQSSFPSNFPYSLEPAQVQPQRGDVVPRLAVVGLLLRAAGEGLAGGGGEEDKAQGFRSGVDEAVWGNGAGGPGRCAKECTL